MKVSLVKLKIIALWLFAILLAAFQPVESTESFKEIEETQEVKLYCENREEVKQSAKGTDNDHKWSPLRLTSTSGQAAMFVRLPLYILYGNLNFYE